MKNEKLTQEIYLQKIVYLENLLKNTLNLNAGKRQQFNRILFDSQKYLSLFENINQNINQNENEKNQLYLNSFFNNLLNLQSILENINKNNKPVTVNENEAKTVISLQQLNQIISLAGTSLLSQTTSSSSHPIRLRIIYFLLYVSGLKATQLAYLDYDNIKKLLDKKEIELQFKEQKTTNIRTIKVFLKDFQKEIYTDLFTEIEKDIDTFFIQEKYKYLGSAIFKKNEVKDLTRPLKLVNDDLEYICKTLEWKKITTHNFRQTFIINLLKHQSFYEIEKYYPYLNQINKRTYL